MAYDEAQKDGLYVQGDISLVSGLENNLSTKGYIEVEIIQGTSIEVFTNILNRREESNYLILGKVLDAEEGN